MALGNNEIDLGSEDLEKLTVFPLLCANIRRNDGSPVPGLKSHLILERCGKRFLIIGLAPFYGLGMLADKYNVFFEMGNLHTLDPVPAVTQILCENRGKYDFSILLSHSGHAVDRELAKRLPPVDLWLEGHSHSVVTEKCCSQSGMGEFLGRVTLDVQEQGIEILDSVQIELPAQESAEFMYRLGQAQESAEAILSQELPVLRELDFDPFRESEFTNFICDCLKAEFGCDLALMHSGIAEGSLRRPVSRRSLLELLPSKLNPTIYSLPGEKLLEAAKLSLNETHIRAIPGRAPASGAPCLAAWATAAMWRYIERPSPCLLTGSRWSRAGSTPSSPMTTCSGAQATPAWQCPIRTPNSTSGSSGIWCRNT